MAVVFLKKNLFLNFFSHGHYPTFVGVTWSFLRLYLSRRKSGTFFIGKKSPTPFCFSGCSIAQPSTSIGSPEKGGFYRFASLSLCFSVAVTRSQPYTTEKVALGLWRLVKAATPPPSQPEEKSGLLWGV